MLKTGPHLVGPHLAGQLVLCGLESRAPPLHRALLLETRRHSVEIVLADSHPLCDIRHRDAGIVLDQLEGLVGACPTRAPARSTAAVRSGSAPARGSSAAGARRAGAARSGARAGWSPRSPAPTTGGLTGRILQPLQRRLHVEQSQILFVRWLQLAQPCGNLGLQISSGRHSFTSQLVGPGHHVTLSDSVPRCNSEREGSAT
jgi:hypothetical protein